jgi:hypothetical protein
MEQRLQKQLLQLWAPAHSTPKVSPILEIQDTPPQTFSNQKSTKASKDNPKQPTKSTRIKSEPSAPTGKGANTIWEARQLPVSPSPTNHKNNQKASQRHLLLSKEETKESSRISKTTSADYHCHIQPQHCQDGNFLCDHASQQTMQQAMPEAEKNYATGQVNCCCGRGNAADNSARCIAQKLQHQELQPQVKLSIPTSPSVL